MPALASVVLTKLEPPRLMGIIPRPRLFARLDEAAKRPYVLVHGPPGAGATTLVASWLSRRELPFGWLSLDVGDNDPRRFWRHFVESLRHLDPEFGVAGLASLAREPASYEHVSLILRDLRELPHPALVVLDDVDTLTAPSVAEALDYLTQHLGAGVCVIATAHTRSVPGTARLHQEDHLAEIGPEQLAFTAEEVCALHSALAAGQVTEGDGERIAALTEGWAAGVVAVAQALASEPAGGDLQSALAAVEAPLADYFRTEVLDRQPPEVREFLLNTAVLDTPTRDMCRRVALRPDAGAILHALAVRHQFVAPAGPETYHYHRMFRKALLELLADQDADRVDALHARVAACLDADGDSVGAMANYAAAGHYDRAVAVAVWWAIDVLNYRGWGPIPPYAPGPIPADFWTGSPYRRYAIAACQVANRDAAEAGRWLPTIACLPERAEVLGLLVAGLRGDTSEVLATTTSTSAAGDWEDDRGAETRPPWLDALDSALEASVFSVRIRAHLDEGDLDGALQCSSGIPVVNSRRIFDSVVDPGALARVQYVQGDLYRAEILSDAAIAEAERFEGLDRAAVLDALAVRGALAYERNELVTAELVLRETVELGYRSHAELTAIWCELELARVRFARGFVAEALDSLADLNIRMRDLPATAFLRTRRLAYESAMRIAVGHVTWAKAHVEQLPAAVAAPLQIRLDLLAGDLTLATARVAQLTPLTRWERIECHLLRAQLSARSGSGAQVHLGRAIDEARQHDFVRSFVDGGLDIHRLLRALNAESADRYVRRLAAAAQAVPARFVPIPARVDKETLTRREGQVLRYLATSLPYAQIAKEMSVSRNTLKKHVQHIYWKLDVTSREDAVAAGRGCGLL